MPLLVSLVKNEYKLVFTYLSITAWNLIQTEFTCCGVKKASDWIFESGPFKHPQLPESCCTAVHLSQPQVRFQFHYFTKIDKYIMIFFNLKCHINNPTLGPYEKGCLEGLELAIFENAGFIGKNHVPS